MFKKLFISFCLIALFLPTSLVFAKGLTPLPIPTPTPTKEEYDFSSMTTYEMFWPIVAGKIPGDRFYNLKLWRDKLVGYLFFSPVKKSEYLKQLANKRLLEAEKLVEIGRKDFFPNTLKQSWENLEKGFNLLFSAQPSQQTVWLKEEYRKDLEKYLVVLKRLQQEGDREIINNIDQAIEKIKTLESRFSQPL